MRSYLDGRKLDSLAMERLQVHEATALRMHSDGYYLAYSGGKDSDVILDLAKRSGVTFTAHHNLTTCDAPETVRHVRTHPEVEISKPAETMWQLIRRKKMPPRRNARYCCQVLKERGGAGRLVVTGIRWGESGARGKRRMVEACYRDKTKRYLHCIIDWTTADVWSYVRERGLAMNPLYAEGFRRVGCVLCPMSRETARDLARWPRLCAAWRRAVEATGTSWEWWLDRDASARKDSEPVLFEDDPGATT